jgi:hypothetical protein
MLLTNDVAIEAEMVGKAKFPGTTHQHGTSPFDEWLAMLGEIHDESAYGAIERLVEAGEAVGFSAHDLIRMLNGGMTLSSLLDLIEIRMAGACSNAESTAA